MAKSKIVRSCAVTFYEGKDPETLMSGIWTRRDLDVVFTLLRRQMQINLAEARSKEKPND
jgi:hypothetical protein